MAQLNFKKMYLISSEKYDTLNTTSTKTNNSNSSILSTSQISDKSDAQHAIDLQAGTSSQQTKWAADSNDEGIFAKRKKTSSMENKLVPDVTLFKCHGLCAGKEKHCPGSDCKDSIAKDVNTYPNIYKMSKATQTEGACEHKTRPHFRKTFTRIYKSKPANRKDTGFNINRKRYRQQSDTNTSDVHYTLKNKRKKYDTDHSISSKINTTNRNLASPTNREQKSSKQRWIKLL